MRKSKIQQLLDIAKRRGVKVHFVKYLGNFLGQYDYKTHTIDIERRSCKREMLYILSHELGHAQYRHGEGDYDGDDVWDSILSEEIAAWNYAGRLARKFGFFNTCFIRDRNRSLSVKMQILNALRSADELH